MIEPVERIINLALLLAETRTPVSAEQIRDQVNGYPLASEQDDGAFKRMFERDKERLAQIGLALVADDKGFYHLDPATFVSPVSLAEEERVLLHGVLLALSKDPTFPFADDLPFALSKINMREPSEVALSIQTAENTEEPRLPDVGKLVDAVFRNKRVAFTYSSPGGVTAHREVEPYGVFALRGQWYLVANDISLKEVRTYLISRVSSVAVNPARPKSLDFSMPDGFRVSDHIKHPFQIGEESFVATILFSAAKACAAESLTSMAGELHRNPDGTASWHIDARSSGELARWVVANGPGITLVSPPGLARTLEDELRRISEAHRRPID